MVSLSCNVCIQLPICTSHRRVHRCEQWAASRTMIPLSSFCTAQREFWGLSAFELYQTLRLVGDCVGVWACTSNDVMPRGEILSVSLALGCILCPEQVHSRAVPTVY